MRVLITFLTLLLAATASAQQARYEAGKHYAVIDPPVSTDAEAGEVEVVEVFSYLCPHCYRFHPFISKWVENAPDNVEYRAKHAMFNRLWEAYARAYITAKSMGIADQAHADMFEAIHEERKGFRNMEQIAEFYSNYGVSKDDFLSTSRSFSVDAKVRKNDNRTRRYGITGTPTLIVAGKYRISSNDYIKEFNDYLNVADYLVELETAAADTDSDAAANQQQSQASTEAAAGSDGG